MTCPSRSSCLSRLLFLQSSHSSSSISSNPVCRVRARVSMSGPDLRLSCNSSHWLPVHICEHPEPSRVPFKASSASHKQHDFHTSASGMLFHGPVDACAPCPWPVPHALALHVQQLRLPRLWPLSGCADLLSHSPSQSGRVRMPVSRHRLLTQTLLMGPFGAGLAPRRR